MSEGPKIVKKKKKWGKVYSYQPTSRSNIITKDMADDIAKDLKKSYVTTPSQFAAKHGITISLAKKILRDNAATGKFELVYKNSKNQIYS